MDLVVDFQIFIPIQMLFIDLVMDLGELEIRPGIRIHTVITQAYLSRQVPTQVLMENTIQAKFHQSHHKE